MLERFVVSLALILTACEATDDQTGDQAGDQADDPPLISLAVALPDAPAAAPLSIAKGLTRQLRVTGTYEDGRTADLTAAAAATWESSDPQVASLTPEGSVVAMAEGTTRITVTVAPVVASFELSVSPPQVVAIAVTPSPGRIGMSYVSPGGTPVLATLQLTAEATLTDQTRLDVSQQVAWSALPDPLDGPLVTLSPSGLATTLLEADPRSYTIVSATLGDVTGTTTLTVYDQVVALEVEPILSGVYLVVGESSELAAFATWASLPSLRIAVEGSATWASSDPGIIQLGATPYIVTCAAAGMAEVSAIFANVRGAITLYCLP